MKLTSLLAISLFLFVSESFAFWNPESKTICYSSGSEGKFEHVFSVGKITPAGAVEVKIRVYYKPNNLPSQIIEDINTYGSLDATNADFIYLPMDGYLEYELSSNKVTYVLPGYYPYIHVAKSCITPVPSGGSGN